jgi:sulfur carrier protein
MFVNEKYIELEKEINLALFLKNSSYELEKIAVEINEKIVSKKDYETTILKNSDSLEIVCFVGGG